MYTRLPLLMLVAIAIGADDAGKQEPGGRIAPIPPATQPTFSLRIQEKPLFPEKEWPKAAAATSDRGLSITIQAEQPAFALNGPLAFQVVLTNESDKAFQLHGAAQLGGKPKLVVANMDTAAQWTLVGEFRDVKLQPAKLEPGKSLTYTVVAEGPEVRPGPFPIPVRPGIPEKPRADEKAGDAIRIAPDRPIVAVGPPLPCGQGKCRTRLLLEFSRPEGESDVPYWVGRIATNPVDFEVGAARPVVAPQPRPIPRPLPRPVPRPIR